MAAFYNVHFQGVKTEDVKVQKEVRYEWGNLNVTEFLQKLAQDGIVDAKVESSANGVMIHLVKIVCVRFITN